MCEVQCTKTNVNGCDAFSEYHFYLSNTKTFQCTTLYRGRLEGLECKYF